MSPEGRTVAVTNVRGKQSKLFLFDVAAKKVVNTIPLGEKATMSVTVFSPDGKWIAVSRQVLPENVPEPEAEDVPQPHIHLIEAATGELRETLVAPQCFSWSLCFSPDGRTLASSGLGSVLLWDVANLTGAGTRADQEK